MAHSHNPPSAAASASRRAAALAWMCAALALGDSIPAAPAAETKAALIIKIGKFVHWPDSAFANSRGALQLCVVGAAAGDNTIDSLQGTKLQDRVIAVSHVAELEQQALQCQIVFISKSERERLAALLSALAKRPVLTLSDLEGFVAQGGMIGFSVTNGKADLEINRAASARAGVTIGAQLLQIALAGGEGAKP